MEIVSNNFARVLLVKFILLSKSVRVSDLCSLSYRLNPYNIYIYIYVRTSEMPGAKSRDNKL